MRVVNALNDDELVSLLKQGDQAAYTQLYDRYERLLFTHAYKRLQNREEARDIVQELLLVLWTKREDLSFKPSLRIYLFTAIRNRIFDLISHQKIRSEYINSLQQFIDAGEYITDHKVRHSQLLNIIEKEIALLPSKMREVFELSRNEQLSHNEIAERLGISPQTVKKQVQNALKVLKVKLGPLFSILFL